MSVRPVTHLPSELILTETDTAAKCGLAWVRQMISVYPVLAHLFGIFARML